MQNESKGNHRLCTPVASAKVPRTVRFDNLKHLPKFSSGYNKRRACVHCKAQTNVTCSKCMEHLCLSNKRNCYIPYHSDGEDSDSNHADSDSNHVDSDSNHADRDSNTNEQQPEENASVDCSDNH